MRKSILPVWNRPCPTRMLLCVMMGACVLAGCGPAPTTVSGMVTLDGQPLGGAMLEFLPVAGDGPTAAASTGPDGRFWATVSATKTKVVIHASQVIGQSKIPGAADNVPVETRAEILPPRYSDRQRSELSVLPLRGRNTVADFPLVSGGQ